MDFDDISIVGIIGAVLGFGIGVLVAKYSGVGLIMRLIVGLVCAIACYFITAKIVDE